MQQTNFMTRLNFEKEGKKPDLDPYVAIDVDEVFVERTSTKSKTRDPDWNETFSTDLLRSAEEIGFTVFHDATVPPDDFIANCKFPLSDLISKAEQPLHEIWVDLEPKGKLHIKIELQWATQDEQNQPSRAFQVIVKISCLPPKYILLRSSDFRHCFRINSNKIVIT